MGLFKKMVNLFQFGVIQMIVVCEYADQAVKVIELSERWKGNIIPSIGVHPIQVHPIHVYVSI